MITTSSWTDRVLNHSEIATVQNRATWIVTGMNPPATDEIARRTVEIALQPDVEDPSLREADSFRIRDIRRWTRDHRANLLAALITLVCRWKAAPKEEPTRLKGGFERWSEVLGGVLLACDIPDFLANAEARRAMREDPDPWGALLRLWLEERRGEELTASDIVCWLKDAHRYKRIGLDELPTTGVIGNRLRVLRGKVVAKHRLVSRNNNHKIGRWSLIPLPTASKGAR